MGLVKRSCRGQAVWMAATVTVNDVLDGHVGLDIECLDRIYLNGYVGLVPPRFEDNDPGHGGRIQPDQPESHDKAGLTAMARRSTRTKSTARRTKRVASQVHLGTT